MVLLDDKEVQVTEIVPEDSEYFVRWCAGSESGTTPLRDILDPSGRCCAKPAPLDVMPDGVELIGIRVAKEGEYVLDGFDQVHRAPKVPVLSRVVRLAPGWEMQYDITRDAFVPWRIPPAFPESSKDWTEYALDVLWSRLSVKAYYSPGSKDQNREGDTVNWIVRGEARPVCLMQTGRLLNVVRETTGSLARLIDDEIATMAQAWHGQKILTVALPLPRGLPYVRQVVQNGVCMRGVLAQGNGKWGLRFDVLWGEIPA